MLDSLVIAQFCLSVLSLDPKYDQSCNKALEATSAQTGVHQTEIMLEDKAKSKIEEKTGTIPWVVGGIGYMLYKEKKLKYEYKPKDMPFSSVGVDAGLQSNSVSVGWKF